MTGYKTLNIYANTNDFALTNVKIAPKGPSQ